MDAPHFYVRAWVLDCFHSHISTRNFLRTLTASVDSCAEIKCPFSGVTKSGRVWRKVLESDARSVHCHISTRKLSQGADRVGGQLRGNKECPFSGAPKSDRVWRKVPESDARSVSCKRTLQASPSGTLSPNSAITSYATAGAGLA